MEEMTWLIVAVGILLCYALAVFAVKYEEELKEISKEAWEASKEMVDRWFPEKEDEKEEEETT